MTLTLPTKSQIQQKANQYVLANSPLTDVRQSGNLNALTGGNAYVLADYYRDLRISMLQTAMQGAFDAFGFSALSGSQAGVTLQVTVSQATTIPQGFTCSTVGNANNPAVVFQSTAAVSATVAGTVNVTLQAVNVGASGNVAAGAITNAITAVPGVVGITNPSAATGGTEPETLSQQLSRFQTYVQNLMGATTTAVAYAASQASGVEKAAAFAPQYLTAIQDANNVYTDDSANINAPKGVTTQPFVSSPTVSDAFYIGASGPFGGFYIDVATAGSALAAVWEYYGTSGWTSLTTTTDNTNNGQQSGSVTFSVPSDWASTSVNGSSAYYVRLRLTSATYTTMPTWYSIFTNDPPPGYMSVYVTVNPAATNVLTNVQTACDKVRADGNTILINTATTVAQNVTVTVTPTSAGASQDLNTLITNALNQLFDSLGIGAPLVFSDIYYAIMNLGAGTYVYNVKITTPSADVVVAPSQLLTAGTFSISIGAPIS